MLRLPAWDLAGATGDNNFMACSWKGVCEDPLWKWISLLCWYSGLMECVCLLGGSWPLVWPASLKWTCGEIILQASMHFCFQHVLSSVSFSQKSCSSENEVWKVQSRNHLSQYHSFSSIFALYTLLIHFQKMMNHKGNVKKMTISLVTEASGYWICFFLFIWLISSLLNMRQVALIQIALGMCSLGTVTKATLIRLQMFLHFCFYFSVTESRNVFCMFWAYLYSHTNTYHL